MMLKDRDSAPLMRQQEYSKFLVLIILVSKSTSWRSNCFTLIRYNRNTYPRV